jgi:hypothetical protein
MDALPQVPHQQDISLTLTNFQNVQQVVMSALVHQHVLHAHLPMPGRLEILMIASLKLQPNLDIIMTREQMNSKHVMHPAMNVIQQQQHAMHVPTPTSQKVMLHLLVIHKQMVQGMDISLTQMSGRNALLTVMYVQLQMLVQHVQILILKE